MARNAAVVKSVEPAQPDVELDAVQHPGSVVEAEDVVGEQVAVAVDNPSGGDAVREERFAPGQELDGQRFDVARERIVEH